MNFIQSLERRALLAGDIVIDWNNVTIDVLRADTTRPGPTWASRTLGMVHAAIYDAVNGIGGSYTPYLVRGPAPTGASLDAAVAQAAHDVLVSIYPGQSAFIDDALEDTLAEVPNGPAERKGVNYGHRVAGFVIRARLNDGSSEPDDYTVNPAAGHWQPDPLNPTQTALGPEWGAVKPFTMISGDQFRPDPQPVLTSAQYTAAFNDVKNLGGDGITTAHNRTPDQTQIGIFWGYDRGGLGAPPSLYDQIAQVIADQEDNTVVENARLLLLVNLAQADSGITCWEGKYVYDFWRPVTAIRRAAEDGNPDTTADTTWTPLGAPGGGVVPNFTPPFPAYASGHATFGASLFKVLERFYGSDQMNFTIGSDELPGVFRSYTSFSQASAENARSRIYLGIHWNFDDSAGQTCGEGVGDWVVDHVALPVGQHGPPTVRFGDPTSVNSVFSQEGIVKAPRVLDLISQDGTAVHDLE